jgi:hypothetical protein
MIEFIEYFIVPITIACTVVGSVGVVALVWALKDKLSSIHVSRSTFDIHTNDILVWTETTDEIGRIDAQTRKAVRKATTSLMIIDPETYDTSAEASLVVWKANVPLIYSAYENHHTRELAVDGGAEAYIADKIHDIAESLQILRKQFPKLTDKTIDSYTLFWIRKILIPNLRRACVEKITHYQSQIKRNDISKPLKFIFENCLTKNEQYILHFDELVERSDIQIQSSIFHKQL